MRCDETVKRPIAQKLAWGPFGCNSGGGKAMLTTVEGGTAMMQGAKLVLTDEKDGTSTVTIARHSSKRRDPCSRYCSYGDLITSSSVIVFDS